MLIPCTRPTIQLSISCSGRQSYGMYWSKAEKRIKANHNQKINVNTGTAKLIVHPDKWDDEFYCHSDKNSFLIGDFPLDTSSSTDRSGCQSITQLWGRQKQTASPHRKLSHDRVSSSRWLSALRHVTQLNRWQCSCWLRTCQSQYTNCEVDGVLRFQIRTSFWIGLFV